MKRQYGLGRKTVNKSFLLFFMDTSKTTIKFQPIRLLHSKI